MRSVLQQTFADFELLVLDNASTDHTPTLVQQFHDERLISIRNPRNVGFVGNVALGLHHARGPLITYLGADDLWEPEFLRKAVACLDANTNATCVHTAAVWIDETGQAFGQSAMSWPPMTSGTEAFLLCFRYGYCNSAMLMRTEPLRKSGGIDMSWGDLADTGMFLRLCLEGNVGYLKENLARYRVRQHNISSGLYQQGNYFQLQLRLAEQAFDWPRAHQLALHQKRALGVQYLVADAVKALHLVRATGTRRDFLRSFLQLAAAAPQVLRSPSTWARLLFGLLPRPVIFGMQRWRRQRWARTFSAHEPPLSGMAGPAQ
jgi:glycosyltransferase involved in cell wall biosynthesis